MSSIPTLRGRGTRQDSDQVQHRYNQDNNLIDPDSIPRWLTQRVMIHKENIPVVLVVLMTMIVLSIVLCVAVMSLSQPSGAGGEGEGRGRSRYRRPKPQLQGTVIITLHKAEEYNEGRSKRK